MGGGGRFQQEQYRAPSSDIICASLPSLIGLDDTSLAGTAGYRDIEVLALCTLTTVQSKRQLSTCRAKEEMGRVMSPSRHSMSTLHVDTPNVSVTPGFGISSLNLWGHLQHL